MRNTPPLRGRNFRVTVQAGWSLINAPQLRESLEKLAELRDLDE